MSDQAARFTTPVGRFVQGSAGDQQKRIDPVTKQPKLNDQGEQTFEYFIGIAIPKDGSGHWANTEWGKIIWAAGFAGFAGNPALVQAPGFAWKTDDVQEIKQVGELLGVGVMQEAKPLTPTQVKSALKKKGIDESVILPYHNKVKTGVQLITDDGTKAKHIFSQEKI